MRTSITGTSTEAGFSLVEMLVAVLLISLLAALVAPRLPMGDAQALQGAAARLGAMTRFLHNEASLTGQLIQLEFDKANHRCQALTRQEDGTLKPGVGRGWSLQLPKGIQFGDLERLGESQLRTEQTQIRFYPGGWADDTRIWLKSESEQRSWTLNPLTGVLESDDKAQ